MRQTYIVEGRSYSAMSYNQAVLAHQSYLRQTGTPKQYGVEAQRARRTQPYAN